MNDLRTMVWKEWKDIILQGGRAALFRPILLVVFLGAFIPLQTRSIWLSLPLFALFSVLWAPLFVLITIVSDAFAGERERHTLESLLATRLPDWAILFGKIAVITFYAWVIMLASLLVGLVVVNVAIGGGHFTFYPVIKFVVVLLLGLLIDLFGAAAGVLISLRSSTVRQAQQIMSIATAVFLFGGVTALQALSPRFLASLSDMQVMLWVAGIAGSLAALLLVITLTRFKRSRLIVG